MDTTLEREIDRLRELGYEPVLIAFHNAKGDLRTISRFARDEGVSPGGDDPFAVLPC